MARSLAQRHPSTPSLGGDQSSPGPNTNAEPATVRTRDGDGALIPQHISSAYASRVLTRLAAKAIASGTAQVEQLELTVDGGSASVRVQVSPRTGDGAPELTDGINASVTESELRRSQRRLRKLAEHLQTAREEERTRIAREIHDQMGQSLTALKIDLACLRSHLGGGNPRVEADLAGIVGSVEAMIESVQDIAADLRPRILDDFGLFSAVEWQVEKFSRRTGISCTCKVPGRDVQIEDDCATALFRILQEALTNVARHACASNVAVILEEEGHWCRLTVLDDGCGVQDSDTGHPRALGLIGMQERARSLGGEARIKSRRGGGTSVEVRIPVRTPEQGSTAERRLGAERRRVG